MSAFFSKADVKDRRFRLSPNVCFRPKAVIHEAPNPQLPNVRFTPESGRSLRLPVHYSDRLKQ